MKITLKTLIESQLALTALAQNPDIPARPSYWIGRALDNAEGELTRFHKARKKLLETQGATLNDKTDTFDIPPESKDEVTRQYEELIATEIDLPGDGVPLDSLGEAKVAPAVMKQLAWLIKG